VSGPFPNFEVFDGRQGETFCVLGPNPVALTLTAATTWGQPFAADMRQPFTIQLRGPLEPFLPQGMYPLEHPAIEGLEVFLVPLGPGDRGMQYEAIFA
jgi:hypothetical protein